MGATTRSTRLNTQILQGFRDVLRYMDENPSGLELTVEVTA